MGRVAERRCCVGPWRPSRPSPPASRWERRRARRLDVGPWRATWPSLAADRTSFGNEPAMAATRGADGAPRTHALPERESLDLLRAAGVAVTPVDRGARRGRRGRGGPAVRLGTRSRSSSMPSDWPTRATSARRASASSATSRCRSRVPPSCSTPARRPASRSAALLVEPMADPGIELIVGMRRDASFGPVVRGRASAGSLPRCSTTSRIRLAPVAPDDALDMLDELRGARLLDGVRGGRPSIDRAVAAIVVARRRPRARPPRYRRESISTRSIASPDGALAVDALVVLDGATPEGSDA